MQTMTAPSTYVQQKAHGRIEDGAWKGVRYLHTTADGTHEYSCPSSRPGHAPHVCQGHPDGTWDCNCESRHACHHPLLVQEWRRQQAWQRLMESQWIERMEARA